jgi:hypothetical protein
MAMSIVQVTVGDFAKWRAVFQKHEPMRAAAGVTNPRIYRGADKSNDVLVCFDVANVAKAREVVASPELKAVMQEAGVIGPPKVHFIE